MNKLLVICGPTATGKTALALDLAHEYHGELLSADSRQVYRGLNAITGKDIPPEFLFHTSDIVYQNQPIGYYGNGTKIWLVDLASPDQIFHVSWYAGVASLVLEHLWSNNMLPIAVGGTGLYLNAITKSLAQMHIPPDPEIRKRFLGAPREELQKEVERVDPKRWGEMNNSDRNNPRRLIRALEIAKFRHGSVAGNEQKAIDTLWIGLTAPISLLEQHIQTRVKKRWQQGVEEVRNLPASRISPSVSTILGFSALRDYISGVFTQDEAIDLWTKDEQEYARRQITWFKKQEGICWFDITQKGYEQAITDMVSSWYTKKA